MIKTDEITDICGNMDGNGRTDAKQSKSEGKWSLLDISFICGIQKNQTKGETKTNLEH